MRFKIIDFGQISSYFGKEVDVKIIKKFFLRQTIYCLKIFKHFPLSKYKSVSIPIHSDVVNFLLFSETEADKVSIQYYKLAIGSLIWPSVNI